MRGYLVKLGGDFYVRQFVVRTLKSLVDAEAKRLLLTRIITDSSSVYLPATWINDMENPGDSGIWPQADSELLRTLKHTWLSRVKSVAADPENLLRVMQLATVIAVWRHWGEPEDSKQWIKGALGKNSSALALLKKFISPSASHSMGSAYIRDTSHIRWKALEELADKQVWIELAARLAKGSFANNEDEKAWKLLEKALRRWEKGIDDDRPSDWDED